MKKYFFILLFSAGFFNSIAQKASIYNPQANAAADIEAALIKAKAEHKFILLQGGGNWCKWCIEFHRVCITDPEIDSIINKNFIWYHLNFSKENKNEDLFAKYSYPQRFGFPVFIILNEKGERIHTQNSEYLEDGKTSYDKKKVIEFLNAWNPDALKAENYK
ncbi:MAG: thioredoxin family protein [Bacteroidota bacterium]